MSEITIRQIQNEELFEIAHWQRNYAFSGTPPLPAREEWLDLSREMLEEATHYMLFEDRKVMASAAYLPMSQNVRGHIYPQTAAVWGVVTHPEGRRKGYARQVLTRLFRAMYDEGIPFSTLYAFRESFYVRMGYATFPQPHVARFSPQPLVPLLKQDLGGHVELTAIADSFAAYRAYLRKRQRAIHGMGVFSDRGAIRLIKKNEFWLATAYVNGEQRGAMLYKILDYGGVMEVPNFYYDDSQGRYLLLEWFARHADQVATVVVRLPPAELPETWFPDLNVQLSSHDAPVARVIDVARVGGMQVGPGGFSARISDPLCPWNEGRYRFESVEGTLQVSASQEAECELSIQGLSALLYGTHDPEMFALRGWGNPTPLLQETMRQMFPPMMPHLHERF